ncbi:NADPH2:quinone reductase [Paenibacillus sp. RC254]|uniref:quinone oxidoreductase family protein n=1 Tax=unclassified Paenibacillus TaxID=185978 RepID=UPI0024BA44C9|nr:MULTISPECIES: NADPH:quinone oxidoreductase family protein [unclassified Paenibacillus]
MKAIIVEQFGSPEYMKYVDIEIPSLQSTQVLIRVHATSVNYADIKARYGKKGEGKLPFLPGLEASGIVEKVGADVKSIRVGQRVIALPHHGSYAEYIVAEENLTFVLPDRVDMDTAGASGIVSFLSYKLLADVARLTRGEAVLIHSAAGGVGTTAIQIAKLLGAGKVIGTVGNENKIPVALSAGADHVICYETEDFAEKVNELTAGKGVQIILDSVAGDITQKSLNCLAHFGRLVMFGNSSGRSAQLQTSDLHASCRSVLGFSLSTTRKERPEMLREIAVQVFKLLENGQLDIKISERFPLKEAALAHQWVESRKSTGKVLLYT